MGGKPVPLISLFPPFLPLALGGRPQNDIRLRFDVARGRDDTIWYVGVG